MSGAPWPALAVASVASFLVYLDVTVVNIAFPEIEREFEDATRAGLAWVLAAYNIVFAALLVPGGRMADRFGRRRVFTGGLLLFTGASAGCALAPSAELLVAARVLQAAGGAALVPASQGIVLNAFDRERRSTAMALWVAAGAVAAAIGPVLGGVLVDAADWRWVFVINLPIGAATLIAGRALVIESREAHGEPRPDPAGVGLAIASVGLLTLAVVQGPEWGWASAAVVLSFLGAGVAALAFIARSAGRSDAAVDLTLFRVRSFSLANGASVLIGMAFYGQLFAAVLFLTGVWGYSPLTAGLALAPGPVAAALAAGVAGARARSSPARPMALAGLVSFGAGSLWLELGLTADPDYLGVMLPATALLGAGGGVAVSMLTAIAADSLPADRFAVGGAVNSATRQIGAAIGVAVVVAAVGTPGAGEAVDAFGRAWVAIALMACAGLAVAAALPRVARARAPGHG